MVALLVALTFILALVIDALVRRYKKKSVDTKTDLSTVVNPAISFPMGYFLTPGHLWFNLHSSGKLLMGIDDMIRRTIGKLNNISLKKQGEKVKKGELLAVLNKGDKEIRLHSPIDGIIERANNELEKSPNKFLKNPYKNGWFYLISPDDLSENLKNFVVADKAKTWWSQELKRLREFIQAHIPQEELAGSTLLDGGFPLDDITQYFDEKTLKEFEASFLQDQSLETQREN